ncbi:MAG: methionine--tRNA ligase [Bdellovibrionales bacterium]|nr:methionine--tRNA ligase [Bdellovibrionales bacterium]
MSKQRNILVTMALPYANGPVHLGHMVEALQADFWVRFQKMRGNTCYFFCADDTHGTPILVRAQKEKKKPEDVIAEAYKSHTADYKDFQVQFDNYSSTNTDTNRQLCEEFYSAMEKNGAISKKTIEQTYCPNDKMFLPDRFIKGTCPNCKTADQYGDSCDACGATYSPTELKNAACAICGTQPILKESEHVFFELNQFKDFLTKWVPQHTSPEISKKLNEWLKEDLRAWDISRDEPYFGFKIPGYIDKYFYVWVDAPIGYIASSKDYFDKHGIDYKKFWQGESTELYHFIGKDIVYFHTLFWPAMLKTAGYRTPNAVHVHGFLTVNGEKMSKSRGTFILARTYLNHLDVNHLRYYFACKLSEGLDDLDLNLDDFSQRVNSDLVGKFINLGSRSAQMIHKTFEGKASVLKGRGAEVYQKCLAQAETIAGHYEKRQFSKATVEIRDLADLANKYFDEVSPWKIVKENPQEAHEHLTAALNIFRVLTIYMAPILPELANKVSALFNETGSYKWSDLSKTIENTKLNPFSHLLQRVEPEKIKNMLDENKKDAPKTEAPATATAKAATVSESGIYTIDDFAKIDLRIARIDNAEDVEGTDKMLKLSVSIGETKKTIFAGIKKSYKPEALIGKQVLVIANLAPRKMKFGISEGMVLCAGDGDQAFIMSPDTANSIHGSKVK